MKQVSAIGQSPMSLTFDKYHGIGNDFIVVRTNSATHIDVSRAIRLCDRHFGVGGDGVLLISEPRTEHARATMSVINADGSRPEMCGNGLRCVALHLCREANEDEAEFIVDTDAGPLKCVVKRTQEQGRSGEAIVGTDIGQGTMLEPLEHSWDKQSLNFERVTTGNPHAICFREQMTEEDLDVLGPELSGLIAGGANIEIATLKSPLQIDVLVWERGVGRTLACGTGAAATAIAAVQTQRAPANQAIVVNLPGGPLEITVSADLRAHLRGPAQWIYSGSTDL